MKTKMKKKVEIPEVTAKWEEGGVYGDGLAVIAACPFCGREHIHEAGGDGRHVIAQCPRGSSAYYTGYVIRMDPTTMPVAKGAGNE